MIMDRLFNRRSVGVVGTSSLDNPSDTLLGAWGGGVTAAGTTVNESTALTFGAVMQAVRLISEGVAQLPLLVYRRLPGGGKSPMPQNPLSKILGMQADDETSAFSLRRTVQAYALTRGNGYAEIERSNRGDAIALHLLNPGRVTPKRSDAGALVYEVRDPTGVQKTKTLPKENMLHIAGLGFNGITGMSVIRYAREFLGAALAAQDRAGRLFGSDSTPGGMIKVPGKLSQEAFDRLKSDWERRHQAGNAHRVGILEQGADWTSTSMPSDDLQFLETRKFDVTEVARWFNVPPHKLFDLDRSTNNNIEQQSLEFVTDSLGPWLVGWEAEIQIKLMPAEQQAEIFAEHLLDGRLRGDSAARVAYYKGLREAGAINADEIRERENMNPLPGGQGTVYLIPANMNSAEMVARTAGVDKDQASFQREVLKGFLADKTVVDVIANLSNLRLLMETAGIPIAPDAPPEPFLPIVAPAGSLVSGATTTDPQGDVVGGGVIAGSAQGQPGDGGGAGGKKPTAPAGGEAGGGGGGDGVARAFRGLFEEAAGRVVRKSPGKGAAEIGDFIRTVFMPLVTAYAQVRGVTFDLAKETVEELVKLAGAARPEMYVDALFLKIGDDSNAG